MNVSDRNPASTPSPFSLVRYLAKWIALGVPSAAIIGSACAGFLWLLALATTTRFEYPALLFGLPLAGAAVGALYHLFGRSVASGNDLIVDEIHQPGGGVPARMAPFVLAGTVITHLFGGSAGREGTAVQMGGSIASTVGRWLHLDSDDTRTLLMVGVAAGFGAVFGTPVTGAIFAIEVLAIGRMSYEAVVPCLIGSIAADWTCRRWGIQHTQYQIAATIPSAQWDVLVLLKVAFAGVAFGLAGLLFTRSAHGIQRAFTRAIRWPILRPVAGGLIVIALVFVTGTRDYLGLGVTSPDPHAVTIISSFLPGGAHAFSWLWKIIFTALTLGSGFKGGEVTPLFFIGASLGNVLAVVLNARVDLLAGVGFVAVFAGAVNTPLACTMMGVELFGPEQTVYFATGCFVAYFCSGHSGIYRSQRVAVPKGN